MMRQVGQSVQVGSRYDVRQGKVTQSKGQPGLQGKKVRPVRHQPADAGDDRRNPFDGTNLFLPSFLPFRTC